MPLRSGLLAQRLQESIVGCEAADIVHDRLDDDRRDLVPAFPHESLEAGDVVESQDQCGIGGQIEGPGAERRDLAEVGIARLTELDLRIGDVGIFVRHAEESLPARHLKLRVLVERRIVVPGTNSDRFIEGDGLVDIAHDDTDVMKGRERTCLRGIGHDVPHCRTGTV